MARTASGYSAWRPVGASAQFLVTTTISGRPGVLSGDEQVAATWDGIAVTLEAGGIADPRYLVCRAALNFWMSLPPAASFQVSNSISFPDILP